MTRTDRFAIVASALSLSLVTSNARGDVRIALVAPLSGPFERMGLEMRQAARDAVEAVNASNPPQRISLVPYDDECNPDVGERVAAQLAFEDRVAAVIGHCPSTLGRIAPLYEARRIPLIAPNATVSPENARYVVPLGMRPARVAVQVAVLLARENARRVVVMRDGLPFTDAVLKELRVAFPQDIEEHRCGESAPDPYRLDDRTALLFVASEPARCAAVLRAGPRRRPTLLVAVPAASSKSWSALWETLGQARPDVKVLGLFQALGSTEIGRLATRARPAERRIVASRDYAVTLASFELLASALRDLRPPRGADPGRVAEDLASRLKRPCDTVIGRITFGRGDPELPYASYEAAARWTPEGYDPSHAPSLVARDAAQNGGGHTGGGGGKDGGGGGKDGGGKDGGGGAKNGGGKDGSKRGAPFWNAWFERDRTMKDRLERDRRYTFVLDLSRFGQRGGVPPGKQFLELLREAAHEAKFVVRVFLVGGKVRLAESNQLLLPLTLKVNIDKLSSAALSEERLAEWKAGTIDTKDFLEAASAGHVAFDVIAKAPGCGAVAISIWDERGLKPLDHLTYEFGVGVPEACDRTAILTGGAGALLALSGTPKASDAVDAAMHVFELPPEANDRGSIVLYVDRRELEKAKDGTTGLYAWQTQSSLLTYLTTEGQLPKAILLARKAATSKQERPYGRVAQELREKLFTEQGDGDAAKRALATLQTLVNGSDHPPFVLLRLAMTAQDLAYLPLGLLAASADEPVVKKPFVALQPLPRERLKPGDSCVGSWTLGLPSNLAELNDASNRRLATFEPPKGPYVRVSTIDGLIDRLKNAPAAPVGAPPAKPAARGEGLVLLAHHGGGDLWFDANGPRITKEHFARKLGPGGFALVAACSMGGEGPLAYELINKLNDRDVDAMVLSPFPVSPDFGLALALAFVGETEKARKSHEHATLSELYERALANATSSFQESPGLGEMALEFVLLGDPGIQVCTE